MASKCRPDVAAARAQTERMLRSAEQLIEGRNKIKRPISKNAPPGKPMDFCAPRLASARAAFEAAGLAPDPMAQRDGYIRATFQAGQALSCARVTPLGKKIGAMPKPKKPKKVTL